MYYEIFVWNQALQFLCALLLFRNKTSLWGLKSAEFILEGGGQIKRPLKKSWVSLDLLYLLGMSLNEMLLFVSFYKEHLFRQNIVTLTYFDYWSK